MVSVGFGVPNQVIERVGDILDGPIVAGVGIGKEIMAERFQDQKRALDQRIVPGQINVVPDQLPLERGNVNTGAKENEQKTPQPRTLAVSQQPPPRGLEARTVELERASVSVIRIGLSSEWR